MNTQIVTMTAINRAGQLLSALMHLARAIDDGGQASSLHMTYMVDLTVELLQELGGFEEILDHYWKP